MGKTPSRPQTKPGSTSMARDYPCSVFIPTHLHIEAHTPGFHTGFSVRGGPCAGN